MNSNLSFLVAFDMVVEKVLSFRCLQGPGEVLKPRSVSVSAAVQWDLWRYCLTGSRGLYDTVSDSMQKMLLWLLLRTDRLKNWAVRGEKWLSRDSSEKNPCTYKEVLKINLHWKTFNLNICSIFVSLYILISMSSSRNGLYRIQITHSHRIKIIRHLNLFSENQSPLFRVV